VKLLAIDGNSLLNRAYYGIRPLSTREGVPTNAVYGFITMLQRLQNEYSPDAICVCFDVKQPTFRHKRYDQYKATRKPADENLTVQFPLVKDILAAMNIPYYELVGYEADDLLGTIAKKCIESGNDCLIATGDRDAWQLVGDGVTVLHIHSRLQQSGTDYVNTAYIQNKYGLSPQALIDLKALMGDNSDNIPGVPGLGEKTALPLIQSAQTLDALYADLDTHVPRQSVRDKLSAHRDLAFLSRDLVTIDIDVPLEFDLKDTTIKPPNADALYKLFKKLEFGSFIKKWQLSPPESDEAIESKYTPCPVTVIDTPEALSALTAQLTTHHTPAALWLTPHGLLNALCEGGKTYVIKADVPDLLALDFPKIVYNAKSLYRRHDIATVQFDVLLAAHLCAPDRTKLDLPSLAADVLGVELPAPLFEEAEGCGVLSDGAAETAISQWVDALFSLNKHYAEALEQQGLTALYNDIELPLSRVLAEMEDIGIAIDREALQTFGSLLREKVTEQERLAAESIAPIEPINWHSPKQLSVLLFETLQLPTKRKTKTGYSTDIDVLESLRGKHPIVEHMIELRTLSKLSSTYAEGLQRAIGDDGRIHTTFQMTATVTGRLSSTEPNLQNIPIRTELGGELRRMFVASREDYLLVDADYSQIELRVLAHIANDAVMKEAFSKGLDIHTITACEIFGCEPSAVTPLMRRQAKAINFGIVYGMGEHSLAVDLGITHAEAKAYRNSYFARFSGVHEYQKNIVETAKQQGYVSTILGRRRPLPELQSSNHNIRAFGERAALNAPIQGSSADIIKLAMLTVHQALSQSGLQAKLLLQVHDELLLECPKDEANDVCVLVRRCMENVYALTVPLVADIAVGKTWQEAH